MAGLIGALFTFAAAVAAWSGLAWLLTNVPPSRPLAVLAAYVFAFAAITSSGALLAWIALRPRHAQPQGEPASAATRGQLKSPAGYLAHSMLLAIIVLFAAWLQALRTMTPLAAVLLIGLYAFLELAVLFGTRGSVELPISRSS